MADPTRGDLPYGSFGQATYDPDEHIWRFERQSENDFIIKPLGEPKNIIKAPEHADSYARDFTTKELPSRRHARQIQSLIKSHPETQPASNLLAPLLHVSEAIEEAASRHDPLKGDLLDFGRISSEAAHGAVNVAAFPCGSNGSDLRVVQIRNERRGWDDTKDAWIKVPVPSGEETIWSGEGAPIQQIRFARSTEQNDSFLAARLLARTVVFRPIVRKAASKVLSSSAFDVNPVAELGWAKTGKFPHADAAFNPWFTRQFGLVDQAGYFSIWELEGRIRMSPKCIGRGSTLDASGFSAKPLDDGWARILWVHDPDTIAICTRRHLVLSHVNQGDELLSQAVNIGLDSIRGWILGIALLPSRPSHFCLLTSTHLLIYRVNRSGTENAVVKLCLKLLHFRSIEDTTLNLTVSEAFGRPFAYIRSSISPTIMQCSLEFDDNDRLLVHDPVEFPLAGGQHATGFAGWHVQSVPVNHQRRMTSNDSFLLRHREQGLQIAVLTVLSRDLTLTQCLYVSRRKFHSPSQLGEPTWTGRLGVSSIRLIKESFIVDNEDSDHDGEESRTRPMSLFAQRRPIKTSRRGIDWTIALTRIAKALENDATRVETSLDEVFNNAEALLRDQPESAHPIQTLAELCHGELDLPVIEAAGERLKSLSLVEPNDQAKPAEDEAPSTANTRLVLRPIKGGLSSKSEDVNHAMDMVPLYDQMVSDWITPLPPKVSGRVRLAKEQLARRAAVEVALASHLIRTEELPQPVKQESQPTQSFEIPLRGGFPASSQSILSSQTLPGSSPLQNSQMSAFPTPSATPSVTTASSYPSAFAAQELNRLAKYTTFTKSPPSALPRSLNKVLSHWTLGSDPADYDWRATSHSLSKREEDVADEEMTEKERARVQRRAERHMRRQRREAEASQAAMMASSQAPEIMLSQPQREIKRETQPTALSSQRIPQSSQSQGTGLGMPSASQVVPGRFGGRPAKKKRKQGF